MPNLITNVKSMVVAYFLHFNFNTPLVVRYVGGQHTAAHRNFPDILWELCRAQVDPVVFADLDRVFTVRSPTFCNASASEENFRAFMAYGNHESIAEDITKTEQALLKDICPGYVLIMDTWLTFFVPSLHRTPLGMVNLNKMHKNPGQFLTAAFGLHPGPWL